MKLKFEKVGIFVAILLLLTIVPLGSWESASAQGTVPETPPTETPIPFPSTGGEYVEECPETDCCEQCCYDDTLLRETIHDGFINVTFAILITGVLCSVLVTVILFSRR